MFVSRLINWFKNKYYDWYIDRHIESNTGTSNTNYLNPFAGSGLGGVSEDLQIVQDEQQRQMAEAVAKIKDKVNQQVGQRSKENYHKTLKKYTSTSDNWKDDLRIPDLMDFASEENIPEWKKVFRRKFIAKKADVRNKKDKEEMVDKRINHYKELQIKKQIRSLNRQLRKETDETLSKKLKEEIDELTRELGTKRRSTNIIP